MRKYIVLIAVGAIALASASFAVAGEETQTETASITPAKLSKKKPQSISFTNTIATASEASTGQPKSATRTILDLPKQFKVNPKSMPTCKSDATGLANAPTTSAAIAACGKGSQVTDPHGTSAQVTVGRGPGNAPGYIDVEVTGFNAKGNVLLLYAKPTGAASGLPATILTGQLKSYDQVKGRPADAKANKSASKQSLDVVIPPIAAGAISNFEVTIAKSSYIKAKCSPSTMTVQATSMFTDGSHTVDSDTIQCKPKK